MRFIVYSDLHLHLWSYGSKLIEGHNSRLLSQIDVLHQMRNYAVTNKIRDIFCCGDIHHTQGKIDAEVLMAAHPTFTGISDLGIKQWWIPGNHDFKDKAGTIHSLSWLKSCGALIDKQEIFVNYVDDISLAFLPYTESKDEVIAFFDKLPINSICFIHQGVQGVPMTGGWLVDEIFDPSMIPDHVKHVFAGHYHDHKLWTDQLTIPGAPMQHTWRDAGQRRGWLDVKIEGDRIAIKQVESKHPKFVRGLAEAHEEGDFREDYKLVTDEVEKIQLSAADFSDLDTIVDEFAVKKKLNKHTTDIGKQLREGKYEVPLDES